MLWCLYIRTHHRYTSLVPLVNIAVSLSRLHGFDVEAGSSVLGE